MPDLLWFLGTLGDKIELDRNLKFTPARLLHFERWTLDHSDAVGICVMELELHLSQPVRDIFIVDSADKDLPFMGVIGWRIFRTVFGVEGNGFSAINEGSMDLDSANTFRSGRSRHLGRSTRQALSESGVLRERWRRGFQTMNLSLGVVVESVRAKDFHLKTQPG